MRTRSEIVFAVVSKKELLGCRGDVDLQRVKAGARSVRIKVTMRQYKDRNKYIFVVTITRHGYNSINRYQVHKLL